MAQNPTMAELIAALAIAKAEVDSLKQKAASKKVCKVSEKGGISVYGFGRFPVTLYPETWGSLAEFIPTVLAFRDAEVKAGRLCATKEENQARLAKLLAAFQAAEAAATASTVEVK